MFKVLLAPSFHTHIEIFEKYEIFKLSVMIPLTYCDDLVNMVNIVQLWK